VRERDGCEVLLKGYPSERSSDPDARVRREYEALHKAEGHGEASRCAEDLAGKLLYVAPEQTGRMDRGIDFRSDLYSLGATLYHALTGEPPLDAEDPLGLIHAHLAKQPVEFSRDCRLRRRLREPPRQWPPPPPFTTAPHASGQPPARQRPSHAAAPAEWSG
jgi:serine/threonine protein kinase